MATVKIKTTNDSSQVITVNLGGTLCRLTLRYSFAGRCWYLSIETSDSQPICMSRRISSGFPITGTVLTDGLDGLIMAYPISIPEEKLGPFPWGSTHELIYSNEAV